MADLSHWTEDGGVDVAELTVARAHAVLTYRRERGHAHRCLPRALDLLLGFPRELGVAPLATTAPIQTATDRLLAEFENHLLDDRGLSEGHLSRARHDHTTTNVADPTLNGRRWRGGGPPVWPRPLAAESSRTHGSAPRCQPKLPWTFPLGKLRSGSETRLLSQAKAAACSLTDQVRPRGRSRTRAVKGHADGGSDEAPQIRGRDRCHVVNARSISRLVTPAV